MKKWLSSLFILLLSNASWGESFNTGQKLLAKCSSVEGPLIVWCTGYLQGVADAEDARAAAADTKREICVDKEKVSSKQLRLPVIEYLQNHPEELQLGAGDLVLKAYREAFPCE